MKLYEVHVPLRTNDGRDYRAAIEEFENSLMDGFGGFHRLQPVKGAWRDDKDYIETMVPFCVAAKSISDKLDLRDLAFAHFPDQKAIFVAEIGEATIYERETK